MLLNGKPLARDVPFKEVQVMSLGDSASADAAEVAALNVGLRHAGWVVESIRSTSISLVFAARGIFDGHLQKLTTMWDIAGGVVPHGRRVLTFGLERAAKPAFPGLPPQRLN